MPQSKKHDCIKEVSLVINIQLSPVSPVFLCILGLLSEPSLLSFQCLYKSLGNVRYQPEGMTLGSEEKKKQTADGGYNTGVTLLVEAAIWLHALRTVLLEQKGRNALVWDLGPMAKALFC